MKTSVLFVHGAGGYEEDGKLAASLRELLGSACEVRYLKMPDDPGYAAWKNRIAREIVALDDDVVLVGHSLGASVLLKYLSEEEIKSPVAGLFLVATPYWGAEDWEVDEYALGEDFASKLPEGLPIFLYHGREDEIVPFDHLALYEERLPRATFRGFDGRGHQFEDDLSEVAGDIQTLTTQERPS